MSTMLPHFTDHVSCPWVGPRVICLCYSALATRWRRCCGAPYLPAANAPSASDSGYQQLVHHWSPANDQVSHCSWYILSGFITRGRSISHCCHRIVSRDAHLELDIDHQPPCLLQEVYKMTLKVKNLEKASITDIEWVAMSLNSVEYLSPEVGISLVPSPQPNNQPEDRTSSGVHQ